MTEGQKVALFMAPAFSVFASLSRWSEGSPAPVEAQKCIESSCFGLAVVGLFIWMGRSL